MEPPSSPLRALLLSCFVTKCFLRPTRTTTDWPRCYNTSRRVNSPSRFNRRAPRSRLDIERIRRILLPFEYTRVDNIVDLVFETQQETDQKAQTTADLESEDKPKSANFEGGGWEFTPRDELNKKRLDIVRAFFNAKNAIPLQEVAQISPTLRMRLESHARYQSDISASTSRIGMPCDLPLKMSSARS